MRKEGREGGREGGRAGVRRFTYMNWWEDVLKVEPVLKNKGK
jgi:hypothetical protein